MLRLKQEREAQELSQRGLAKKARVGYSIISMVENGRLLPYPDQLKRLAAALNWSSDPADLLQEIDG